MSYVSAYGVLDYCVFVAVLIISLLIGVYASFKGNRSPEEFLTGNRSFGPIPIAMSLLTSIVSAISLLGFSGEAYAFGCQLSLFIIGIVLGISFAGVAIVPVLYPLKLTSVNEYIEVRFESAGLRMVAMIITTVGSILFMGVCLYAPTIALSAVTPLTSIQYIFILGIVVTIYSSLGGIRAVVWTDVFQLTVMLLGLLIITVASLVEVGGFSKAWNIVLKGGRLDVFNTNGSLYERHNIYNTITFGFFLFSSLYGVSQINVQRLCSVRSLKDSYLILVLNTVGMVLVYILIFGSGILAYAIYEGCDPLDQGFIKKKEEILPYLVVNRLNYIKGLPGIFVATIIGGALSSLSSVMNATVAMLWEDVCSKVKIFSDIKPFTASIINKVLSVIIGVITIGTALIASRASSLIEFTLTLTGVTYAGVFGVFLLGFLFPKTNVKGVWGGMIVSMVCIIFIGGGSFIYGKVPEPLSFSSENCNEIIHNNGSSDARDLDSHKYNINKGFTSSGESLSEVENFLMYFFEISYTLYLAIGTSICVISGIIISSITGGQDIKRVSPEYISPFVRKYYWTEEELKANFHS
ncbi:UNVERIFIED_CONTAM: hypothetical protein RMT77_000520 [Armadillidium vulgare]